MRTDRCPTKSADLPLEIGSCMQMTSEAKRNLYFPYRRKLKYH
jgi:hypothetical protein